MSECISRSIGCDVATNTNRAGASSVSSYGNVTVNMSGNWDWKDNVEGTISKYDNIIKESAKRLNLDWRLCAAMAFVESAFNPNATNSGSSAKGMWQITDGSWPKGYSSDDATDVQRSTLAWEQLMREGLNRCRNAKTRNDQIAMALQQYHDGTGTTGTEWTTRTPGKYGSDDEARKFVPRILKKYEEYCK